VKTQDFTPPLPHLTGLCPSDADKETSEVFGKTDLQKVENLPAARDFLRKGGLIYVRNRRRDKKWSELFLLVGKSLQPQKS